ncbi:MAG: prepilin-type N-terminal cleavage/methylation domain-containing protein [Sharpea porci]
MMKMLKKNKGFTLIEIIVVIVILAVLMAVAVPSVMSYINEGNKAKYETVARGAMVNAQVQLAKAEAGEQSTEAAYSEAISKTNADSGDISVTNIVRSTDGKKYDVTFKDGTTATVTVNKKVEVNLAK